MSRTAMTLVLGASVLVLAGCSASTPAASTTSVATTPPTTPASTSPTTSTTPAAATTNQSVAQTSLDPCQLVTRSEASALAGTAYGAGREETFPGGGKGCVYGYQTLNVFTVEVARAPDAATAQADWTQEQARAQAALKQGIPASVHVALNTAQVANLGDRAATASATTKIAGRTISITGIYVLKGAIFYAFQDLVLGHPAPSAARLESQAQKVLGRLP